MPKLDPLKARAMAKARKSYPLGGARKGSGRPKVLRACERCATILSARELRAHKCA